MPQHVIKVRVFAASPGDVSGERERLARVVESLNRTLGRAESLVLELVRWETHAWPGFGEDAQDVINRETDPYDLFVGIMWKRLGTPTKRADSGTVEEFERAYQLWRTNSVPYLMFYFSLAPFFPDRQDLAQVEAVLRFKDMLKTEGALYWEYKNEEEFEALVHEHLYQQLRRVVLLSNAERPKVARTDSRSAVIDSWIPVKREMEMLAESRGVGATVHDLKHGQVISDELGRDIRSLRKLRDAAARDAHFIISENEARDYASATARAAQAISSLRLAPPSRAG